MFNFRYLITLLLLTIVSPVALADITIEDAWIREAPPVSRVQAAYATFKNSQADDVELIKATSPAFAKIEFHKTISENGLTKMQAQASVTIPAKGNAELKPEGMHMMLFNPVNPVRAGNKIEFHFTFSNGNTTSSSFIVKKATGINHHQHMHH